MWMRKLMWCVGFAALLGLSASSSAQEESSGAVPALLVVPAQSTAATADDGQAAVDAAMQEYEKQVQAAREALEPLRKKAPYQECEPISLGGSRHVLGFAALDNNELIVISGAAQQYGAMNALTKMFTKSPANELIWLDADGKNLRTVELSFVPAAVNVAPDGVIFVVGDGKIASFAADGKPLETVDSPHIEALTKNQDQFVKQVRQRREDELKSLRDSVTSTEDAIKVLKEKPEDKRTAEEKAELDMYVQSAASLKTYVEQQEKQSIDDYIKASLADFRAIHRVAASKTDIYIVTRQLGGYGFAVWRMGRDFAEANQIIDGLAGCCGQMDVQVHNDTVFIAENAQHRVGLYDRDGKQVMTFGETNREDIEKGFGSCCNPMNVCFTADGDVLTSESNGVVKRFKTDGQYQEVVGVAKVVEGCKNSLIALSSDASRLYYFDVQQGRLLVLKRS